MISVYAQTQSGVPLRLRGTFNTAHSAGTHTPTLYLTTVVNRLRAVDQTISPVRSTLDSVSRLYAAAHALFQSARSATWHEP
jgi:hypothetical protein